MNYFCDEVIPGLFVGSQYALLYPELLHKRRITHILSMNNYHKIPAEFVRKIIDIDDEESENITQYFGECIEFINSSGKVLVFCAAGRSRSVTIVAAYLIKEKAFTMARALDTIKVVRKINPNPGFLRQLRDWETQVKCPLCQLDKLTKWLEETEKYVIMECEQCGFPMIVYKQHSMTLSQTDSELLERSLRRIAEEFFGRKKWRIDRTQRTVLHHLHWHARPILFEYKL